MKISRPNAKELSSAEIKELENLKLVIERAVADGRISQQEISEISAVFYADGKVTFEELTLYRQLVTDKVAQGFVEFEY